MDFLAPHSLFSSHRVDSGTRLLLDNLPAGEPERFLDLGSGYGALGLPVAARFPRARGLLVDRDLLAVEFSKRNVALQNVTNVEILASLGYRDVPRAWASFDWILSNVPARAGERVIGELISSGRARLESGGEMRIVAILPLKAMVEKISAERRIPCDKIAETSQHVVFAFPPGSGEDSGEEVYHRDWIELGLPERLKLERPTDLADEPHRLETAIPLLARRLPARPPEGILVFRSGYGLLPALSLARYPSAKVVAADRDLLATAYTRRNCGQWGDRIQAVECLGLSPVKAMGPFELVLGELSPPIGPEATLAELREAREALAPGGTALVLGLLKQWKEFLRASAEGLGLALLESEGPAAVYALTAGRM